MLFSSHSNVKHRLVVIKIIPIYWVLFLLKLDHNADKTVSSSLKKTSIRVQILVKISL